MVYIRQRNLEKLHEYKYSGVDNSLVSKYILKPFYTNVAIKCFPMSMALVINVHSQSRCLHANHSCCRPNAVRNDSSRSGDQILIRR